MPASRQPVRLWRGLRTRRNRSDQGPASDLIRRTSAAKDALHVALSWKTAGRLAIEWCKTDPCRREAWVRLQITRIASTEVCTIQSAMRTWKHWAAWCDRNGEDFLRPSTSAPSMFLYSANLVSRTAGRVPRTLPTTRFNHMRWIETNLGSPVLLKDSDRPSKRTSEGASSSEQRVASDPEVHVQLDHVFRQIGDSDPAKVIIAIIQLLWMSVLRFQHMQRSVPVKLTSELLHCICWKGKGKPAFRWTCPRYGPTGQDICGCIWHTWQGVSKGRQVAPFGLLYENGVAFSLANFHTASRAILREHLGMLDTDMFSSYSLRRSMPTLAVMNGTHPDDADALGDWTSAKDNTMRIRYADSKEERSATVKLTHVLLVRQMAQSQRALSWDTCRSLLSTTDKVAIAVLATQRISASTDHAETRKSLLKGLIGPKRKFNISALTRHASQPATPPCAKRHRANDSEQVSPIVPAPLPLECGSSRRWVMIKHKGAPRVHLLPEGSDVPLCRRRRGQIGTPIVRRASEGIGLHEIRQMGWNTPDILCHGCTNALPDGESSTLRRT